MRKTLWIQLGSDLLKKYMIFFRFYLTKAEFLALTPKDFDFEKNTLDITKSPPACKKAGCGYPTQNIQEYPEHHHTGLCNERSQRLYVKAL